MVTLNFSRTFSNLSISFQLSVPPSVFGPAGFGARASSMLLGDYALFDDALRFSKSLCTIFFNFSFNGSLSCIVGFGSSFAHCSAIYILRKIGGMFIMLLIWMNTSQNIFIEMDKIVVTELAKTYFDCQAEPMHLPSIGKASSKPTNQPALPAKQTQGSLSVLSLRRLLKNESVDELSKLREKSQKRNYMKVKEELLRDISNNKQFLSVKADQITKKILADKQKCENLNVSIEISKGKNYLNKIIKDFETMQGEKLRLNGFIQERLKAEQD